LRDVFLNIAEANDPDSLVSLLVTTQQQYQPWLTKRQEALGWKEDRGQWTDTNQKVVMPPDEAL